MAFHGLEPDRVPPPPNPAWLTLSERTVHLIARGTAAAPSTVRDWLNRRSSPTGIRAERISELSSVTARLEPVVGVEHISAWLASPLEALGDAEPIDLIARGDALNVTRVISSIEDPGAV